MAINLDFSKMIETTQISDMIDTIQDSALVLLAVSCALISEMADR